MALACV